MPQREKQITGKREVLKTLGLGSVVILPVSFNKNTDDLLAKQEKINRPPTGFLREIFYGRLNKKGVYIHVNELLGIGINIKGKLAVSIWFLRLTGTRFAKRMEL